MVKLVLFLSVFFVSVLNTNAQITNPSLEKPKIEKEKKKKKKQKKVKNNTAKVDSTDKTTYYFTVAYVNSFRKFEDKTPYGFFNIKTKEQPIHTYGVGVGTYIELAKNLDLEIGVSYVLQGEQYNFSDSLSDSTFQYTNKYRHFGLPLRLKYTFNMGKFSTFLYGGVIPSSILSIRYDSGFTTKAGEVIEVDTESKTNTLAAFNMVASVGFGINYQFNDLGIMIIPEYRYNLLNTFEGVLVEHNLWSWGVNVGINLKF